MDKFIIRDNKKGFTLVEIIVVLIIIAILAAIAIPAFTGYIDKTKVAVMEHNQSQVIKTIQLLGIEGGLSLTWNSSTQLASNFKAELVETVFFVTNPINKSTAIKTSGEFGNQATSSAGIIIVGRTEKSLDSTYTSDLYPNNQSAGRFKASGSICIAVVTNGAIVSYYYNEKHYNITKIPIDY
jgi:type IV pilus assembly protein PilA